MEHTSRHDIAAWILAGLALLAVLRLGLLAALLSGLLVYQLVHVFADRLVRLGLTHGAGRIAAVIVVSFVTVALLSVATLRLFNLLTGSPEDLAALMQKMAEAIETASQHYPAWARDYLPATADELEAQASSALRAHASELRTAGEVFARSLGYVFLGMIIGGLAALTEAHDDTDLRPLSRALRDRAAYLGQAFRRVVFAQIRISALNTALTSIYLVFILPAAGIDLPFVKTMIAVTFFAGLLPIIGNLISNTVIVVVSLSVSLYAALGSLAFLIFIHKLEYFVNARIIGGQIFARAWEILLAMLVMESIFGIPGVIAAPIYYAYLKRELAARKLI
ncbi:MAG: AI-2E family transporter [Gemmatimonas sp.]